MAQQRVGNRKSRIEPRAVKAESLSFIDDTAQHSSERGEEKWPSEKA
jgi:hypothetical protein